MSGIIGHTMYAVLAAKAATQRRLATAPLIARHWSSYLAGAYLGSDIQTMPEAICVDTGREVGYGTVPLDKSPLTGGTLLPYSLNFEQRQYRPREIHAIFYGRAHLTFGWVPPQRDFVIRWQDLPEYCSAVAEDAISLFGPGERPLAYALGWMTHLVGDALIKSIEPGVTLHLLDGKYTPRNRPIQDLFTFHEVGRTELQLNWPALLADLSATPVEVVQPHYMRVGTPRGRLAESFPEGWLPDREPLLHVVLAENRRYLNIYRQQVLEGMQLKRVDGQWQCSKELSDAAGGLSYQQMVESAEKARFRKTLWKIAEAIADLFGQVEQRVPQLADFPRDDGPSWGELTERWRTS